MEPTEAHAVRKPHCLKRVSSTITNGLEAAFFHVGPFVGEYPVLTIILSLIICGLCGIGLKTFKETDNQVDLWVPQDSRIINEKTWVDKTFPDRTRFVAMVLESGTNVLTPTFLNAMMDYYSRSVGITVSGSKFSNFCLKVGGKCRVTSLLELWDYNATMISRLTQPEILDKINDTPVSPSFGYEVSTLLGGKITRVNGRIEGATATQITWVTSGQTQKVKDWESNMIGIAKNGHPLISTTYVYASRSFDDEGYGAVDDDISLLTAGFSIVFIFVMLSLGKFNLMEQKIYVSLAGMLCVGLALLFAYGLATAMDLIYSPIQSIMPFLLLGIGVDDMFVVVEAWKNLSPEENALSVPNKMATTLKQAGVSITVTSVTDAVAFGVGASTVIPALSAFCVYAVLGIFALFVLVSTFFSACLSLDERRRRRNLDACVLCYRHKDYTPNKCSQGSSLLQVFFAKFYGPVLMKLPVKTCVVIVTLIIFGVNVWSFTQLKQEFKLATYIPSDSYASQFVDAKERLFDTEGIDTAVYCGGFNYQAYRSQLEAMHHDISVNSYVQNGTVNAWFIDYHTWLNQTGRVVTTESQYASNLKVFLSGAGNSLRGFVKFNSNSNPTAITGSYMTLRHVREPNSASEIESMESLRSIVDGSGLPQHEESDTLPTHKCFAYSPSYLTYETNKVLLHELYRNLGLAGAAVLIVTCVLIANLWTSLLVFFCVIFTVVDVAGTLQFWGTSIDTASSILLTLTVGLAVDYSAHIGHTFMTISGPRKERTVATLRNIGPAVFNGGFSTFLAFVLLANSSSYGFVVFFRVFSTVVLFGLFHGLAFLPVLLSIVGPPAYSNADIIPKSRELTARPDPGEGKETSAAESVHNGEPHHIEELNKQAEVCWYLPKKKDALPSCKSLDCLQQIELSEKLQESVEVGQDLSHSQGQAYDAPFTISDSVGNDVLFTPRGGTVFIPAADYEQGTSPNKVTKL